MSGGPLDPLCYLHIEHAAQGPPLATPYPHVPGLEEAGRRGFMTPFMNWQPTRSGVQKDLTSPLASNSAFLQEAGLFQRHGGEPHSICAHLLGLDESDDAEPRQIYLRPNRPCPCSRCAALRNGCICMICCRQPAAEEPLQTRDGNQKPTVETDAAVNRWGINIIIRIVESLLPTHVSSIAHMGGACKHLHCSMQSMIRSARQKDAHRRNWQLLRLQQVVIAQTQVIDGIAVSEYDARGRGFSGEGERYRDSTRVRGLMHQVKEIIPGMALDLDDSHIRYTWQQEGTNQVAWSQVWAIPYCASPAITPFDESETEHYMPLAPRIAAALALIEFNWKALGTAADVEKFGRFIFEYILEDVFDGWEPLMTWWEDVGSPGEDWEQRPTRAPDNPPQELTHMQDVPPIIGGTGFGTYSPSARPCDLCGAQRCHLGPTRILPCRCQEHKFNVPRYWVEGRRAMLKHALSMGDALQFGQAEDPPKVTMAWWREAHGLRNKEYLQQPSAQRLDRGSSSPYMCKWNWRWNDHNNMMHIPRMGQDRYQPLPGHMQIGLGSLGLYEGRGIWRMGQEVEVDTPDNRRDVKHIMVARGIEMLPDYERDHISPTFKPAKSALSKLRRRSQLTREKQLRRCYKIQFEVIQRGVPYESWLGEILHIFLLRPRLEGATFGAALLLTLYPDQRMGERLEDRHGPRVCTQTSTCAIDTDGERTLSERRWSREWNNRMRQWFYQQWKEQPSPMEGVVFYCDDEVGMAMYTATESLLYQSGDAGA